MKSISYKKHFLERHISVHGGISLVLICACAVIVTVLWCVRDIERSVSSVAISVAQHGALRLVLAQNRIAQANGAQRESETLLPTARLPEIDIERMKRQGCVTDGLLSGYGNEERNVALINRLPCYYLHRAVETWLDVPSWREVERIKSEIVRRPLLYGMFIAEAIDKKARYVNTATGERFRFKKMCKPGTDRRWGPDTCVPDFDREEYRRYAVQIMKEAIDHDIQVFLIGQVQVQDARRLENSDIEPVLEEVRTYARDKGVDIAIGAQTNDATDKDYLRLFDFIEGGIGLHEDGSIEDGPCFLRYSEQNNWCWALLWHERYTEKAQNIFVHLDWSGMKDDDMATFVGMDSTLRAQTLRFLSEFYREKGIGFLLPVLTALPEKHEGCYGNRRRYYSADGAYSCGDEEIIESILTNYK